MPYKNRKKEYAKRKMTRLQDKLAAFEEFNTAFPKSVQQMLLDGAAPEEILEQHAAMIAARVVAIAMTEQDSSRALAAAKDVLDRAKGKAVERIAVAHKYEKMSDDALDALLISKLKDAQITGGTEDGNT